MTPLFGEFLSAAGEHITAACGLGGELPDDAKRGVIRELDRVVTTLTRYLGDLTLPDELTHASNDLPDTATRTAADARIALCRAAGGLHRAARAARHAATDDTHPAVRHLSSAAGQLAAGRDLLQTHFASGPADAPTGSSYWAPVITSVPVTAVLLSELAACSRHLAAWTAQLAETGTNYAGLPAEASLALHTASRWLHLAGTSRQAQPSHSAARRLLAAIPTNIPPPRRPPRDGEAVPELCEGITITAERLRHAARAFAGQARWSPAANSVSWRRDALASAITSHAAELILHTLAERARQPGSAPAIQAQLASAADTIGHAWPAWRAIARQWDIISTGAHHARDITPAAAEFGDLVLRTGRLAYGNPHWTPACARAGPGREQACTAGDIKTVVAAVHHATDAISRIAIQDSQAARAATTAQRLYMPTRLLPETTNDLPRRYSPVPTALADELLGAYGTAVDASLRAAIALDGLAVTIEAPSSMLGAVRTTISRPASVRQPARQAAPAALPAGPGQVESILRSLQITEPAMLLRGVAIDQAARDLLAQASENSRNRDNLNRLARRPARQAPARAARTASKDLPAAPNPDQPANLRPIAPVGEASPGRPHQTRIRSSHGPAT